MKVSEQVVNLLKQVMNVEEVPEGVLAIYADVKRMADRAGIVVNPGTLCLIAHLGKESQETVSVEKPVARDEEQEPESDIVIGSQVMVYVDGETITGAVDVVTDRKVHVKDEAGNVYKVYKRGVRVVE